MSSVGDCYIMNLVFLMLMESPTLWHASVRSTRLVWIFSLVWARVARSTAYWRFITAFLSLLFWPWDDSGWKVFHLVGSQFQLHTEGVKKSTQWRESVQWRIPVVRMVRTVDAILSRRSVRSCIWVHIVCLLDSRHQTWRFPQGCQ